MTTINQDVQRIQADIAKLPTWAQGMITKAGAWEKKHVALITLAALGLGLLIGHFA